MPTPSSLLDILLLPAFYLALAAWVAVSMVLLLRGLSGGRRAIALARARQGLSELRRRKLDPPRQMGALVALVSTLPDRILLPLPHRRRLHDRVASAAAERGYPDAFVSAHFDQAGLAGPAYRHAMAAP